MKKALAVLPEKNEQNAKKDIKTLDRIVFMI